MKTISARLSTSAACLVPLAFLSTLVAPVWADSSDLYELEARVQLESSNTEWDYMKMEPGGHRLFIARLKDGLSVFDTRDNTLVATLDNSEGANGPLVLPQFNRLYVAMSDGSLLSAELDSLDVIERVQLAEDGGLNSAIYDPNSQRIFAITGFRKYKSTWFVIDPKTGDLLDKKVFPFQKMDDPTTDNKGNIYAPARLDNLIIKLDADTLEEKARWQTPCNVAKVIYQETTNRILAACLEGTPSAKPQFFVLNADTGELTAQIPVGLVVDAMAVDEQRGLILVANGKRGDLSVIKQHGADKYELLGNVPTQEGARMMAMDEQSGKLYLVTANFHLAPGFDPKQGGKPEYVMEPDTFVVLVYAPAH